MATLLKIGKPANRQNRQIKKVPATANRQIRQKNTGKSAIGSAKSAKFFIENINKNFYISHLKPELPDAFDELRAKFFKMRAK